MANLCQQDCQNVFVVFGYCIPAATLVLVNSAAEPFAAMAHWQEYYLPWRTGSRALHLQRSLFLFRLAFVFHLRQPDQRSPPPQVAVDDLSD